jgi:HSP20 family protein
MTRRDPFSEIEELFDRMDRELDKLGAGLDGPMLDGPGSQTVAVDVIEDDGSLTVAADLPGFDGDDVDVELHDDALTIAATREEGEQAEASASEDARYHLRERRHGSVSRRIPLPAAVEPDGAAATYDDGVLTVTLPKRRPDDGDDGHRIDIE